MGAGHQPPEETLCQTKWPRRSEAKEVNVMRQNSTRETRRIYAQRPINRTRPQPTILTVAVAGGGLVVMADAFVVAHRVPIILAAARSKVPAVYIASGFVRDGGLLSYGADQVDTFRRAATYVDRILRGAKPGDLPVQLPVKYEMVLNLKTAKALGLAVPPSILLRADEVIE
jgi:ABC-type uncharacterized transport system substrate-binding protein